MKKTYVDECAPVATEAQKVAYSSRTYGASIPVKGHAIGDMPNVLADSVPRLAMAFYVADWISKKPWWSRWWWRRRHDDLLLLTWKTFAKARRL